MSAQAIELEAAIEANPDDPAAYIVYGDWLCQRGDVRGELIALHWAGKLDEASALIEAHQDQLWGRVAGALAASRQHPAARGRATSWRWGFLESLWLSDQLDAADRAHGDGRRGFDTAGVLGELLAQSSTRFLRELTIGTFALDDTYRRVAEVIARRPRPTLRALTLGDNHPDDGLAQIGDLSPLAAALPNLAQLTLIGGAIAPGPARPPRLAELCVSTNHSQHDSLPELCVEPWPTVTTLRLWLGINTLSPASLVPVLDGQRFPRLAHLELGLTTSPALCAALASSPIAQQLETLALPFACLDDDDARALASGQFPRLRELDVSNNALTSRGIAAVRALCPHVDVDAQQP